MTTLSIQPSFREVIRDVQGGLEAGSFWINFIPDDGLENGESQEEVITITKEGELLHFFNSNGVSFQQKDENVFQVEFEGLKYRLITPRRTIDTCLRNTTSFDVSSKDDSFIMGLDDGSLSIGSLNDPNTRSNITEAHLSTVTETMFFPSGEVALSTGLDLQIKIWDIRDGSCPRTLSAQKSRITGIAIVDRGRNILSSSFDGTVNLWDCGSGISVTSFKRAHSIKDGATALSLSQEKTTMTTPKSTYEFGTLGKRLLVGYQSGVITSFDLGSREETLNIAGSRSSVVAVGSLSDYSVIAGYENGSLKVWDLRNPQEALYSHDLPSTLNSMDIGDTITASYGTGYSTILSPSLNPLSSLAGVEDDVVLFSSTVRHFAATPNGTIYQL